MIQTVNTNIAASYFLFVIFVPCSVTFGQAEDREGKAAQFSPIFSSQAKDLALQLETESDSLKWLQEPLMRFSITETVFGSVFIWLDSNNRPAIIGTIGSTEINGKDEGFSELHLLAPNKLRPITIDGRRPKTWRPIPMPETEPIKDAAAVAASAQLRINQMRTLARSYAVEMNGPDGRPTLLRLLPQPLYRYAESTPDRDGALFAFVFTAGTDPELLLRIESRQVEGKAVWCMQPLRFTWRSLQLLHNGDKVWEGKELATRDDSVQTTPYITTLTNEIGRNR